MEENFGVDGTRDVPIWCEGEQENQLLVQDQFWWPRNFRKGWDNKGEQTLKSKVEKIDQRIVTIITRLMNHSLKCQVIQKLDNKSWQNIHSIGKMNGIV